MILDEQSVLIFISMLDGSVGAGEILNDYLDEHGQWRIVDEDFDSLLISDRLPRILDRYLPRNIGRLIACDFAEHAIKGSSISQERKNEATKLLASCREFFGLESSDFEQTKKLQESIQSFAQMAREENPKNAKAVWSVWATFMGKPSNVVLAARDAANDEELWQLEYAIKTIPNFVDTSP